MEMPHDWAAPVTYVKYHLSSVAEMHSHCYKHLDTEAGNGHLLLYIVLIPFKVQACSS